jgi:hypothetical protein
MPELTVGEKQCRSCGRREENRRGRSLLGYDILVGSFDDDRSFSGAAGGDRSPGSMNFWAAQTTLIYLLTIHLDAKNGTIS